MSEKKQLNEEQLEKVTGGSHVKPSEIYKYVGQNMKFSMGIFGIDGPYPVFINEVKNGTVVNMTFTNPNNMPKAGKLRTYNNWTELPDNTWEWDYDDGATTWLE